MSAELKPCPFCGEVPGVAPSGYVFCMSPHDCPAVQIGTSVEQWNTRAPSPDLDRLRGENERLREALTPSGATKDAYMGEFTFTINMGVGDDGNDQMMEGTVPWTTVKEIMAAITKRALEPQ